jgi:hypothetical protein
MTGVITHIQVVGAKGLTSIHGILAEGDEARPLTPRIHISKKWSNDLRPCALQSEWGVGRQGAVESDVSVVVHPATAPQPAKKVDRKGQ